MAATRLILTCGLPGAGKTTLAVKLATDRLAVRLTKDEWLWNIGTSPWNRSMGEKVEQELWRLAQEILGMRSAARHLGIGVELHYLDVPVDELWRRIEERNAAPPWDKEPITRVDLDEWVAIFQAPDAEELALFDPAP